MRCVNRFAWLSTPRKLNISRAIVREKRRVRLSSRSWIVCVSNIAIGQSVSDNRLLPINRVGVGIYGRQNVAFYRGRNLTPAAQAMWRYPRFSQPIKAQSRSDEDSFYRPGSHFRERNSRTLPCTYIHHMSQTTRDMRAMSRGNCFTGNSRDYSKRPHQETTIAWGAPAISRCLIHFVCSLHQPLRCGRTTLSRVGNCQGC